MVLSFLSTLKLYPGIKTTTDPDEAVKQSTVKSVAFYFGPEKTQFFFTIRVNENKSTKTSENKIF